MSGTAFGALMLPQVAEKEQAKLANWAGLVAAGRLTPHVQDELATYLFKLAGNRRVLDVIAKEFGVPKKRPHRPREDDRILKVAYDYVLTCKRLGKGKTKAAQGEVGDFWGLGRTQVYQAGKECTNRFGQDWRSTLDSWAEQMARGLRSKHRDWTHEDVLRELSRMVREG